VLVVQARQTMLHRKPQTVQTAFLVLLLLLVAAVQVTFRVMPVQRVGRVVVVGLLAALVAVQQTKVLTVRRVLALRVVMVQVVARHQLALVLRLAVLVLLRQ
jgi:hypothetical protein